ncbi:MAG: hypothetical protein R2713_18770 [Ilumatobacteraceae bacterium]
MYDYVSSPYRPYLTDRFRFTRDFMRDTVARIIDVNGPHAEVIAHVDMPPVVRDARPGGVGCERHPRQARARGAVASDAPGVPHRCATRHGAQAPKLAAWGSAH